MMRPQLAGTDSSFYGLGLYWDSGKENGSYYIGGYIGIMEKKMETTILGVRVPHFSYSLNSLREGSFYGLGFRV